jgi:hypothetical protein
MPKIALHSQASKAILKTLIAGEPLTLDYLVAVGGKFIPPERAARSNHGSGNLENSKKAIIKESLRGWQEHGCVEQVDGLWRITAKGIENFGYLANEVESSPAPELEPEPEPEPVQPLPITDNFVVWAAVDPETHIVIAAVVQRPPDEVADWKKRGYEVHKVVGETVVIGSPMGLDWC